MSPANYFTIALAVITGLMAAWVGLFRYTVDAKEAEFDRQLKVQQEKVEATVAELKDTQAQVNNLEKRVIELNGELKLIHQEHGSLKNTVEEIKRTMVTLDVYEQRTSNLERTLNRILDDLTKLVSRSRYGSSDGIPALNPKR